MKYMLLIYEDDADRLAMMDERMPNCAAYAQAMTKAGIYVCGERLRGVATTTTVRVTPSKTHVVDGPYAEAKDLVNGYVLIEAATIDKAVELSKGCPIFTDGGSVEVRPILKL